MRARDPEKRSRLLRAAAIAAVCSGFVGGLIFFGNGIPFDMPRFERQVMFATSGTMMFFWLLFLPLYIFTVHKSRRTVEFEHQARWEERRRAERTREALKSGGAPGKEHHETLP